MFFSSIFRLSLFLLFVISYSPVYAATVKTHAKASELKQLDQEIRQLQQDIQHDKGKKGQLSQQLKLNTAKLVQLERRLAMLQHALGQQKTTLVILQKKKLDDQQKLSEQRQLLVEQLRDIYYLLRTDQDADVSMSSSEQEDDTRLFTYYSYLTEGRFHLIQQWQDSLDLLNSKQHQVIRHQMDIHAVFSQQKKSEQQLTQMAQSQKHVLNQLATQIQSKNAKLSELLANRQALEQLVKKLQKKEQIEQKKQLPIFPLLPAGIPFAKLQGKLPWPLTGPIIRHFGAPVGQSELKYTGVLLAAHVGQPVYPIDQGRVIFSNWLQGLGLLLIIDHGNGYMSLYGYNQVLYKKVGDIVKPHDLIASVGLSGQGPTGLYFEIRDNGKPVNPECWCVSEIESQKSETR